MNQTIRSGPAGKRYGFTLIEIMIVSVLITVIGMVVFSAFRQGFKLWERAQYTSRQEQAIILINRIARELNNSFQFAPIGFKGDEETFYFPSLMMKYDWDWSNKAGKWDEDSPDFALTTTPLALITKVTYEYKESDRLLERKEEVYAYPDLDELKMNPDAYEKETTKVMISDIDSLVFSYVISRSAELNFDEKFATDAQYPMPYAVKIDLALKGMRNPLTRTIFLPICRSIKNENN